MPIELGRGNLLEADVEALVNPVNAVGVMGKGLALQFKQAFPEIVAPYQAACASGELTTGRVQVIKRAGRPGYVVTVVTKRHWRQPAKIDYVRDGLVDLVRRIGEHGIGSIAVPPLGCGLGGLDWAEVRPLVVGAFEALPDVRLVLFEPEGSVKETANQASRRGGRARSGGGSKRG